MKTGKAAVLVGYHQPLEIREFEIPQVEPGAVLLKVDLAGICGTDVHIWEGKLGRNITLPQIIGHEALGTIAQLGAGVTSDLMGQPVQQGDRIFPYFVTWCGKCYSCLRGDYTVCRNLKSVKPPAWKGIDDFPWFVGGYGEYVYLRPGIGFFKLPDDLPTDIAAAFACAGPTVTHALWHDPIRTGETVVVQGSGPVGLYGVLISRILGARQVINIGAPAHRLEIARRLGADETINIEEMTGSQARVQRVKDLTDGIGADAVLECSGSPLAVPEGMALTRSGGRYFVIGQYSFSGPVAIHPEEITLRELELQGSHAFVPEDIYTYLNVIRDAQHRFPLDEVTSHRFPLDQADQALQTVRRKEAIRAVLIP